MPCDCCSHPSATKYGNYKACDMCKPLNPIERFTEGFVKDSPTTSKKAKYREVTYKCASTMCNKNTVFARQVFVVEWLE